MTKLRGQYRSRWITLMAKKNEVMIRQQQLTNNSKKTIRLPTDEQDARDDSRHCDGEDVWH